MKTKILIASICLMSTPVYAQPLMPVGGMSPPVNRSEVSSKVAPSIPRPAGPMGTPQPAVRAAGGNGGLITGNGGNATTPVPSSSKYGGVGMLPANAVKAPVSVGTSTGYPGTTPPPSDTTSTVPVYYPPTQQPLSDPR